MIFHRSFLLFIIACIQPSLLFAEENGEKQAWLLYAAGFTGAPASIFGHAFLVVGDKDSIGPERTAIQYVAALDGGLNLKNAALGAFGTLPGQFITTDLHDVLRGYRGIEMRDVWEYPTDFTDEECWKLLDLAKTTPEPNDIILHFITAPMESSI